eukprot:CAMPEP_0174274508 /NCGR_PEP_ID=MMETSP0439-20130205/58218_1 /TAXON_ID=0 /ORGANISM="Stereomyxa ramosa, Strain Chinc5" /LENGTH=88 /DNA_ID=CAMNT_0015366305 /DNA_START=52 /DNA_END=314 /DNA_ORIENTATION=-
MPLPITNGPNIQTTTGIQDATLLQLPKTELANKLSTVLRPKSAKAMPLTVLPGALVHFEAISIEVGAMAMLLGELVFANVLLPAVVVV